ncbi:DUF6191 domain-containing protein [Actinoallomurus sp. NPDC050550]|uniref:DUF6191 domain-containing protein n=1 Tax=Actinoallomurus sp. NPDC050550 TaxID=3154937 RepID=UPI0033F3A1ED
MAAYAAALPVLACVLLVLAGLERTWIHVTGHGILPWLRRRSGTPVSATGFDEFTAIFQGSKRTELQHRQIELVLRDDDSDGAPPGNRVDLDQGIAFITKPSPGHDAN